MFRERNLWRFRTFRHLYQGWLRLLKPLRLKRNESVPLNAGVLIVGSLLWDSEWGRPTWRDARFLGGVVAGTEARFKIRQLTDVLHCKLQHHFHVRDE